MNKETDNQNEASENRIERPMSHRILAWICIVLLVGMYTVTLISALSGGGSTSALFMMSLGSTVVLPGLLWLYIRFWKFSSGRDRETFREELTGVKQGASMSTDDKKKTTGQSEEESAIEEADVDTKETDNSTEKGEEA